MKIIKKLLALIVVGASYNATGQQIQTDRPNETEGPNAVPFHQLQFENGFSFEKKDGEKTFEVPQTVLRYGLLKNTELRVESSLKITDQQNDNLFGIEPVIVGIKYHILDHKKVIPDLAVLGRVRIPWMADNAYQEPNYSPEVRLLAQHELSKSSHLGYNAGVQWLAATSQPEYIYTLSADYAFSQKIKFVVETYGFAQAHHHADNSADIALLYLVNGDMQLDVIAGNSIMNGSSDKFAEIGLSFKI
ncbi:outer membrane putative beta-barrel porin/alpha-amylase [Flavobacterium sp. 270]|uniref:transporter n=1 Tax=Flavobacterium sp. 270 TaxID=2512114 RepID=UPI0010663E22|nr:transporter [Flavobacterium sp. 270]TDW46653.1 outer membrane putative beta-barrel porin/alpha-amylase [Flavobacterium sp. 270]